MKLLPACNNLRQLGIACQAHESIRQTFPYTSTRWSTSGKPPQRFMAISPHRALMAQLDPAISQKVRLDDPADPAWSTLPPVHLTAEHTALQQLKVPVFACPSDDVRAGGTSYRANLGISTEVLPPSKSVESTSQTGAFVNGRAVSPFEFIDGLSNTALFSERVVGDADPKRYDPFRDIFANGAPTRGTDNWTRHCAESASWKPESEFSFAGGSWLLGGWLNTWYIHALPPNSTVPDCGTGSIAVDGGWMVVTARSLHPGLVNVVMGDGAVRGVSQQIDARVWRALGTRNGRDAALAE